MKILFDMNVSPLVADQLKQFGFDTVHWSGVGDPRALDTEIMDWARLNNYVVVTHDLDYGALLHATGATGPSVIQFRDQDIRPQSIVSTLRSVFDSCTNQIAGGSLITISSRKVRVAILPLKQT